MERATGYQVNVRDGRWIIGLPQLREKGMLGHMANDAGFEAGVTETADQYARRAAVRNNASLESYHHFAFLRATKDIVRGAEIGVTYGYGYWTAQHKLGGVLVPAR